MSIIDRIACLPGRDIRGCVAAALCLIAATAVGAQTFEKPTKLSPQELTTLINKGGPRIYYGGVMIPSRDTLSGPAAVISGSLDIQEGGAFIGDVWIVDGKLILTGAAVVDGDVNLVNSRDYLSHDAVIRGTIAYYACECAIDDDRFDTRGEVAFLGQEDPRAARIKLALKPGAPNRTDYTIFKVGLERRNSRREEPYVGGHALIRVPLWLKTRGYLGFDVDLSVPLRRRGADLFVRGFKRSFTNDGDEYSSLDAIVNLSVCGLDFSDYYERRGGEIGLRLRPREMIEVAAAISLQRDVSLQTREAPSLFDSDLKRRANPPIDDGDRVAISGHFTLDTRDDVYWPENAWHASVLVEKGVADGPGEFSYTAFEVDIRRYDRLAHGLQCNLRGRLFSAFDGIPRQVTRSLHGYNGIRGLESDMANLVRGDRVALLSAELSASLPGAPYLRTILSRWHIQFFTDMGLVAQARNISAPLEFLDAPFDRWERFAGIGIIGETAFPFVGFYLSQDLGNPKFEPHVRFQMERTF